MGNVDLLPSSQVPVPGLYTLGWEYTDYFPSRYSEFHALQEVFPRWNEKGKVFVMRSKCLSYWLLCLWERIKSFTWSHKCAASFKWSQHCFSPVQNWRAAECLMFYVSHSIPHSPQLWWKEWDFNTLHAHQRPPLSSPPTGTASEACPALTIPGLISFCSLSLLTLATGEVQNARWSLLPPTVQEICHILLLVFISPSLSASSLKLMLHHQEISIFSNISLNEGCSLAHILCNWACRWLLPLIAPGRPFFLFPPSCKYQLRTLSHQSLPSSTSLVDITCWLSLIIWRSSLSHYLGLVSPMKQTGIFACRRFVEECTLTQPLWGREGSRAGLRRNWSVKKLQERSQIMLQVAVELGRSFRLIPSGQKGVKILYFIIKLILSGVWVYLPFLAQPSLITWSHC